MSSSEPNTQPNNRIGIIGALGKYAPIIAIIVYTAIFAVIGYVAGNFLGLLLSAVYGQASADSYLASSVLNASNVGNQTVHVVQSQGAYYYLMSMTIPNTYSLIGLFLGGLIGLLIAIAYIEAKHSS